MSPTLKLPDRLSYTSTKKFVLVQNRNISFRDITLTIQVQVISYKVLTESVLNGPDLYQYYGTTSNGKPLSKGQSRLFIGKTSLRLVR